jgi:GNAT superfamily N-acetyltransferase
MATVSAAFAHDPAWLFLLGDDYDRLAPHFAGALFDLRVDTGDVWVTRDVAAAALWEAPGEDRGPTVRSEQVWSKYRALAGASAWQRLTAYEHAVEAARPTTPFWYLGVLATHPDRQGEGLASALIAPIVARADHDGLDCCLETSTARNRAFYERRGFTDALDIEFEAGPPTWWLRRPPQVHT